MYFPLILFLVACVYCLCLCAEFIYGKYQYLTVPRQSDNPVTRPRFYGPMVIVLHVTAPDIRAEFLFIGSVMVNPIQSGLFWTFWNRREAPETPPPPPSNSENIKAGSNETIRVYRTSEIVFFEVHIMIWWHHMTKVGGDQILWSQH